MMTARGDDESCGSRFGMGASELSSHWHRVPHHIIVLMSYIATSSPLSNLRSGTFCTHDVSRLGQGYSIAISRFFHLDRLSPTMSAPVSLSNQALKPRKRQPHSQHRQGMSTSSSRDASGEVSVTLCNQIIGMKVSDLSAYVRSGGLR